ncbi:GFA family protein [SAR116 cluster bacterium]|nr:GFA family protein [SAR116 cluster bacterium]
MPIQKGACYCGKVVFEIHAEIQDFRRCNCSICRRKGAIMCTAHKDEFKLISGEDNLSLYLWNTNTARHYFCKTCGIYTHHWRRTKPEFGYNLGCIDGVDMDKIGLVSTVNGAAMSFASKSASAK